jgi:lipopolysaccharide export system ATP-binding protein
MKEKKTIKASIIDENYIDNKIIEKPFNKNILENNKKSNYYNNSFILDKKFLVSKDILKNKDELLLLKPQFRVVESQTELKQLKKENIFNIKSKKNQSLQIKKISKSLGGRLILKNISLKLEPGKIVGLLGPNGSGKTTLFNLIIGKIFPDQGEIIFNDEIIHNQQIHTRSLKGLSLLEQHKGLFGNMTAEENLFAILELHIKDKEEINDRIDALLGYFELGYLKKSKANSLSGGEYKKVSILQRICNPTISTLLLDEPCAALDPLSINSLKKFIVELKNIGLSILITDHNYWAIENILDKAYLIKDGQILVEGDPNKISNDENAIKYYLGGNFRI